MKHILSGLSTFALSLILLVPSNAQILGGPHGSDDMKIGVAGFSYRNFSIDETLAMLQSMDVKYFKNFESDYLRTQFNLILNPAPSVNTKDPSRFVNRSWANFDMLPTVMAALGCEIEGDRLNLGTNLFSKEQTVLEKYGVDYVNLELKKGSPFYNRVLLDE